MVVDYASLIEAVLDQLGKEYERKERKHSGYYLSQNPLTEDTRPSFQWFEDKGNCKSWNLAINGHDTFCAKEICNMTGTYDIYVRWALEQCNIPFYIYNQFKQLAIDSLIELEEIRKLSKCKQALYKLTQDPFFISFNSMMYGSEIKYNSTKKMSAKKERTKSSMEITQPSDSSLEETSKYLEKRKIKESDVCKQVSVLINDSFSLPAIALTYPNKFVKVRFLSDSYRYSSVGKYNVFFEAKRNLSNIAYVVEGEFESLIVAQYVDDDVYSMHNKSTIPPNLSQVDCYEKIIFLVDFDKFLESYESIQSKLKMLEFNIPFEVRPKIYRELKKDFNDLHIEGKLTKELIETGEY